MLPEGNTYGLPVGTRLTKRLRAWLRRQQREVLGTIPTVGAELPTHFPDLADYDDPMASSVTPILAAYWDVAGKQARERVGLDPDEWKVTDPHTKEKIEQAAFDFCETTNRTTSKELNTALGLLRQELVEGIVERGDSLRELRKRVERVFEDAEEYRAQRIAATEASRAVHAAELESARQSGVVAGFEWLLSEDACPLCHMVAAEAKHVRLGQPFAVVGHNAHYSTIKHPPVHPNCCLPETPVIAPVRIAGIEAQYDGPVVRLVLSDGSDVTVTPNHMLLTREGFAQAAALTEGDDVIRCIPGDWMTLDIPEDDRKPVPIHQVVKALAVSPGMATRRMPVAPEDLHGDAKFCQGEIDVVTTHGQFADQPAITESADQVGSFGHERSKFGLCRRHRAWIGLIEKGDLGAVFVALLRATDGGVGSLRERKAIALGRRRVSQSLGLAVGAGSDSQPDESFSDQGPGDAERLRECLLRFPGKVATSKVIEIERLHYRGPVYDVETLTSLYLIGGGIVSSNCQCSVIEILSPEYGGPENVDWRPPLDQPKPGPDYKPPEGLHPPEPRPDARAGQPGGYWIKDLPNTRFVQAPTSKDARERVVWADVAKLDHAWLDDDPDNYVPPGGEGGGKPGAYEQARRFITQTAPRERIGVELGRASLGKHGLSWIDGRHRFAVLRDLGIRRVPVSVDRSEADAFRERFGQS